VLTIIAMSIGVAAVIAVVSLTQGVNMQVSQYLARLGTNTITIIPQTVPTSVRSGTTGSAYPLTLTDAQAIATQIPEIVDSTPVLNTSARVIYQDQNWSTTIQGVYPNFQTIENWQLAEGDWFSAQDEQLGEPVAVIGQTVAMTLFSSLATATDPIGQMIRVNHQVFRIVGVLSPKGAQGASDADNIIFVPFSTAHIRLKPSFSLDQIQIQVGSIDDIAQAQIDIITLLRSRHHLNGEDPVLQALEQQQGSFLQSFFLSQPTNNTLSSLETMSLADPDNFQVLNESLLIQTAQQDTRVLGILLVSIAAISLLVGGIGIMNIMLVSISERFHEIGICMAVGARQRDIRNQFLLESVIFSAISGVIGLLVGLTCAFLLTKVLGFPFLLNPLPVVLAIAVSAAVGIIFGLYPAIYASRLDPIVTLRSV
jgi:putative ABC transport system permease protein